MADEKDFEKAMEIILSPDVEGGFNNIPGDSGGATNLGLSLRFLQSTGDYDLMDIDKDGDIDIDDVALLTKPSSTPIYKKYFWDAFPMKEIPPKVAFVLLDVAINSGHGTAAKLLQRVINVKVDGAIGSKTLTELQNHDAEEVAMEMLRVREHQYTSYVEADPVKAKFLDGWLRRVRIIRSKLIYFG